MDQQAGGDGRLCHESYLKEAVAGRDMNLQPGRQEFPEFGHAFPVIAF